CFILLRSISSSVFSYTTLFRSGISKTVAWLKTADIAYIKPGHHNLEISIKLDEAILKDAYQIIKQEGKVIETFHTEVFDKFGTRSEEHTSELQSRENLVCRLLI